jgi:hypothetical protein
MRARQVEGAQQQTEHSEVQQQNASDQQGNAVLAGEKDDGAGAGLCDNCVIQ